MGQSERGYPTVTPGSEPLEIIEYRSTPFPKHRISEADAEELWRKFGSIIAIDAPTFKNDHQWMLRSMGFVGFIPVSKSLSLSILPKVPLRNLFGMWEYAYHLDKIDETGDLFEADSIEDFYSKLAHILAKKTINRGRKGFYRAYLSKTRNLTALKGRLDMHQRTRQPWAVKLRCTYDEITPDVEENQILTWTLYTILRSGLCRPEVLPTVRRAYRTLAQYTTLTPVVANDCIQRFYSRLNNDYEPMHALCRFFLENTGPSYQVGDRKMVPFIVKMDQLFEKFVAEWLRVHLPENYRLEVQEIISIGQDNQIIFKIDLVLYLRDSESPICILDTKYKQEEGHGSAGDLDQVITYAYVKNSPEAILIYPEAPNSPLTQQIRDIRVRSTAFNLDQNLEEAGIDFLNEILTPEITSDPECF